MKRHLAPLLAAIVIVAPLLAVITVGPVFAASYYGSCSGANNVHFYQMRDTSLWPGYDAARGEMIIRPAHACSGSANRGASLVGFATIQDANNLAQCMFGSITGFGTNYWYTPDNNGFLEPFPNRPRIQSGDDVYCTITATGGSTWTYTIVNVTTGGSSQATSPRVGSGGDKVWWGFEVNNDYDQFGGTDVTHDSVFNTGYSPTTDGQWWYASGDTSGYWHATKRSWQNGTITLSGSNYIDVVNGWTTAH